MSKNHLDYSAFELECPICHKLFVPPMRCRSRVEVLRWFGVELHVHMVEKARSSKRELTKEKEAH